MAVWFPWGMALYRGPSVGLCCWQAGHYVAIVARSALVGGSICFGAHSESPNLPRWLFRSWANCVSTGVDDNRGWLASTWVICLLGCLVALPWLDALLWSLKCNTKIFTLLPTSLGPSMGGAGKLKAHRPNPPSACWLIKFYGNKAMLIYLHTIVYACFCMIRQSWVVATATIWPISLKQFLWSLK